MKAFFPNKPTKKIDVAHIFERFMIHFFSAGGVLLVALNLKNFIYPEASDFVALLMVFTLISFREIWDVKNGNPLIKSVSDWVSWAFGFCMNYHLLEHLL